MDIMEDMVKSVVLKLSEILVTGNIDSEALQVWILKFGEDSKRLRTRMETFIKWIANGRPP